MARRPPKVFPTPVESLVRRRVRELETTTPRPKPDGDDTETTRRHKAHARRRKFDQIARAELPALVDKDTARRIGGIEGESVSDRAARVAAVSAARQSGQSFARGAADHAARLEAAAKDDAPPTPRDGTVPRTRA